MGTSGGEGRDEVLSIDACGPLEIRLGASAIHGAIPNKAAAILVFLAESGSPVPRSKLAGLLWSDHSEERARANLRVALTRLRSQLKGHVGADRTALWLTGSIDYDVHRLRDGAEENLAQAYRGDFLAGFEEPGAELLDEWIMRRRAELRTLAVDKLLVGAQHAHSRLDWPDSLRLANEVTRIDASNEEAHRLMIKVLAATQGRSAAVAHFNKFAEVLEREIGVAPDPSTVELLAEIESPTFAGVARPSSGPRFFSSLPVWPTPILGRSGALAELEQLAQPGRPLSIVGPGGVGKTRLLAAFAAEQRSAGESVVYVSFESHAASVSSETERTFAETILAALAVPVDGEFGPTGSLERLIGDAAVTLCLDNLEQLRDVERAIVSLSRSCPHLQIVLTSRRRLVLTTGKAFELGGLRVQSDAHDAEHVEHADCGPAVELFVDRTSRKPKSHDELATISQVCAMLEGHPLAIELAAHWAETGSLAELIGLILSNDELASDAPDLPSRHRSLNVLVSASMQQLSRPAGRVLRAASVFAGPFTRNDIEAIVPIDGHELAELVEHSLARIEGEMYQLHPHIRRYVESLINSAEKGADLRRRHAQRMVEVLHRSGSPAARRADFQRRAEDFRRGITWLIDHADPQELDDPVRLYLSHQRAWGWLETSRSTIKRTLARTDLSEVWRAELHRHAAESYMHSDEPDRAIAELEQGLTLVGSAFPAGSVRRIHWNAGQVARLATTPLRLATPDMRARAAERARLMALLGELFYVSDRRAEMGSYGLGSLVAGRVSREPVLVAAGDAAISIAAQLRGAHRVSHRYLRRSRQRISRIDANPFTAAEVFGITAVVASGAGNWIDARADCHRALDAAQSSGRTRMTTQLNTLLALIDLHEGEYDQALLRLAAVESNIDQNGFRRALTWVASTRAEIGLRIEDLNLAVNAAETARDAATAYSRVEDEARANAILARAALARGSLPAATVLLREVAAGLTAPSAMGIQHFELHCGAAEAAHRIMLGSDGPRPLSTELIRRLKAYAKAFPIADARYRDLVGH